MCRLKRLNGSCLVKSVVIIIIITIVVVKLPDTFMKHDSLTFILIHLLDYAYRFENYLRIGQNTITNVKFKSKTKICT